MNLRTAMRLAMSLSEASSARRKKVGCVLLTRCGRVCTGINHHPDGIQHPCDYYSAEANGLVTFDEVIHAEVCAIQAAETKGCNLFGSILLTTYSPCLPCAKQIVLAGIPELIYLDKYHNPTGLIHLEINGVTVRSYNDLSCNENHGCNRRSD